LDKKYESKPTNKYQSIDYTTLPEDEKIPKVLQTTISVAEEAIP
jgi:hypothetical protein